MKTSQLNLLLCAINIHQLRKEKRSIIEVKIEGRIGNFGGNFFIHLFICAYIVWTISPPYFLPPHPRQNLFCPYL
jgi:hypothetical protein